MHELFQCTKNLVVRNYNGEILINPTKCIHPLHRSTLTLKSISQHPLTYPFLLLRSLKKGHWLEFITYN